MSRRRAELGGCCLARPLTTARKLSCLPPLTTLVTRRTWRQRMVRWGDVSNWQGGHIAVHTPTAHRSPPEAHLHHTLLEGVVGFVGLLFVICCGGGCAWGVGCEPAARWGICGTVLQGRAARRWGECPHAASRAGGPPRHEGLRRGSERHHGGLHTAANASARHVNSENGYTETL